MRTDPQRDLASSSVHKGRFAPSPMRRLRHPNNYGTDALTEILLRRNINILEIPGFHELEQPHVPVRSLLSTPHYGCIFNVRCRINARYG